MSFQWLQMRITEESDRRRRENYVLQRLPAALEELYHNLHSCIEAYTAAFGAESADIQLQAGRILVMTAEQRADRWVEVARVDISCDLTVPGFCIDRHEGQMIVEVGSLPGDKWYYRLLETDEFLTLEEFTRRILDRTLFPKLK
jgi:hypothetical protein